MDDQQDRQHIERALLGIRTFFRAPDFPRPPGMGRRGQSQLHIDKQVRGRWRVIADISARDNRAGSILIELRHRGLPVARRTITGVRQAEAQTEFNRLLHLVESLPADVSPDEVRARVATL
jgi:hypothetical protein